MAKCELIKGKDRRFETLAGPPGVARVARDVTTDMSTTLGCGLAEFENIKMPWTVKYDEYFYCLEGTLRIRAEGTVYEMQAGDGLWLPKGTELVYEADKKAKLVFTIYPINWRQIEGIA